MTIYLTELTENKNLFPNVNLAMNEPDGLLAIGGELSSERIINAYRRGIFPWFSDDDPILWWSPSRRAIIKPMHCHISKSMKKEIKRNKYTITLNHHFSEVIKRCALPRGGQADTWITDQMADAYLELHRLGFAHSLEVWQNDKLVGGLYGVSVGSLFCGESMFSEVSNSSKIAFIALNQHLSRFEHTLIDCQMQTSHLTSLGVQEISRDKFIGHLQTCRGIELDPSCWSQQALSIREKM